ncbi:hypothetical protein TNCV_2867651 [Trichonephila clavipes]|nr:hypothetical protein TNCV_2867651 [Trichonephila clavipes]
MKLCLLNMCCTGVQFSGGRDNVEYDECAGRPRVDPRIESVRAGVNKMVIRSEGAVEYVMVGVSRRPTQAIWRGKEIEPVQVIVMSFDPVKIVVASELKQFEFNGIEITGFICKIIKKENRGETVSIPMYAGYLALIFSSYSEI